MFNLNDCVKLNSSNSPLPITALSVISDILADDIMSDAIIWGFVKRFDDERDRLEEPDREVDDCIDDDFLGGII